MNFVFNLINRLTCPKHSYFYVGKGIEYYNGGRHKSNIWQCKHCGKLIGIIAP